MSAKHWKVLALILLPVTCPRPVATAAEVTGSEFCLRGQFNLGARLQGLAAATDEFYEAQFCYVTESTSERLHFRARARSNPDADGDWAVSYIPPDTVRIVNRDAPPDIQFEGKSVIDEALRLRRVDPVLLVEELERQSQWVTRRSGSGWIDVRYPGSRFDAQLLIEGGRLLEFRTVADFPLRGRVPVSWLWDWTIANGPSVTVSVDGQAMLRAAATRRDVAPDELDALWQTSEGLEPIAVPGDRWPARISLHREEIAPGVHFVRGVRTGFGHLVVETRQGLIVGDAPAGWMELHQLPPADLVPGLGISGLSENFVDYLAAEFPGVPIRAVAITHVHDDHAGGARAFATAGAAIYAPEAVAGFLETALNRDTMPPDRFSKLHARLEVQPVGDRLMLDDPKNSVELVVLPAGPHVNAALGLWLRDAGVFFQSDLHVPSDDSNTPRADRLVTECWFAAWASDNLPGRTLVLNSHTAPRTPVARLTEYLQSPGCRSL